MSTWVIVLQKMPLIKRFLFYAMNKQSYLSLEGWFNKDGFIHMENVSYKPTDTLKRNMKSEDGSEDFPFAIIPITLDNVQFIIDFLTPEDMHDWNVLHIKVQIDEALIFESYDNFRHVMINLEHISLSFFNELESKNMIKQSFN